MSAMCITLISLLILIQPSYSQVISVICNETSPCGCTDETQKCKLKCQQDDTCFEPAGYILQCASDQACDIDCIGNNTCTNALVLAHDATDLFISCKYGIAPCVGTTVYCGSGHCSIRCKVTAPGSCVDITIVPGNALSFECLGDCPQSLFDEGFSAAPTAVTLAPSTSPTLAPSQAPSSPPSAAPTTSPTTAPTINPSMAPSAAPSFSPTNNPSMAPTLNPSLNPSISPTLAPSQSPTEHPSSAPSLVPSSAPSSAPTEVTTAPTKHPTATIPTTGTPSETPTNAPSHHPSTAPSLAPSESPTARPTLAPTLDPSTAPSAPPTAAPSGIPTITHHPSTDPTASPSKDPSVSPTTAAPTTAAPTTSVPTTDPSNDPTIDPTINPTTDMPSLTPSEHPTTPSPTAEPSKQPTSTPSEAPTTITEAPSAAPTVIITTGFSAGAGGLGAIDPYSYLFYGAIALVAVVLVVIALCCYCKFKPRKDEAASFTNDYDITHASGGTGRTMIMGIDGVPNNTTTGADGATPIGDTSRTETEDDIEFRDSDEDVLKGAYGGHIKGTPQQQPAEAQAAAPGVAQPHAPAPAQQSPPKHRQQHGAMGGRMITTRAEMGMAPNLEMSDRGLSSTQMSSTMNADNEHYYDRNAQTETQDVDEYDLEEETETQDNGYAEYREDKQGRHHMQYQQYSEDDDEEEEEDEDESDDDEYQQPKRYKQRDPHHERHASPYIKKRHPVDNDQHYIVKSMVEQEARQQMAINQREAEMNALRDSDHDYAENIFHAGQQNTLIMDEIVQEMTHGHGGYTPYDNSSTDHDKGASYPSYKQ